MLDAPTITIDTTSPVPAYLQIVAALRSVLVSGRLQAGRRIPTVHELANALGIHHNTVAEAYRALATEGWLDLRRRRGATVLARPTPDPSPAASADLVGGLRGVVVKALADGVPRGTVVAKLTELGRELSEEALP